MARELTPRDYISISSHVRHVPLLVDAVDARPAPPRPRSRSTDAVAGFLSPYEKATRDADYLLAPPQRLFHDGRLVGPFVYLLVVSWGVPLTSAQNFRTVALSPWLLIPVLFVVATVMTFMFLGDGLRDAADAYK